MSVIPTMFYTPEVFAATSYVLRVNDGSTSENLSFPSTGALTVGRYYWVDGTETADASTLGGAGDLLGLLELTIESHSGIAGGTIDCYVASDGYVRVERIGGGSVKLEWAHGSTTLDKLIFGFSGDTATSQTLTAPYLPRTHWRPGYPCATDSRPRQPIHGAVGEAISGLARVSRLAVPSKTRDVSWALLSQALVLDEYAATGTPSFEGLWTSKLSQGYPLRFCEDATDVTDYTLWRLRNLEDPMRRSEYPRFWDVSMRLREVTA